MKKEKIKEICTNINFQNISTFSAQCSYYTILSFIPFVILLITLIQYTRNRTRNTIYGYFKISSSKYE